MLVIGIYEYKVVEAVAASDSTDNSLLFNCLLLASSLTVHFFTLPNVATGITMMKVAITEPSLFVSPKAAFFIGFTLFADMFFLETLNLIMTMTYKEPGDIISGYIVFRINQ